MAGKYYIPEIEKSEQVLALENIQALVNGIKERQQVISEHTLNCNPLNVADCLDAIYDESQAMAEEIERLHGLLRLTWGEIVSIIIGYKIELPVTPEQIKELQDKIFKDEGQTCV